MKKIGFTLAELVITLAIIAVASALILPSVVNLIPDRNKIKMINLYSEINAATETILNVNNQHYIERDIEWQDEEREEVCIEDGICPDGELDCIGLACNYKTEECDSKNKYACYLKKYLGGETNENGELVLAGGVKLTVEERKDADDKISYHGIIVNLGTGGSCVYGEEGCKEPDTYRIRVENDGTLSPCDPLLDAYLRDAMSTHNKKENFAAAEKLLMNNKYEFEHIYIDTIK